ncbi:MAG: multiheme c-type cytochrome [Gammaproteobacteria bacterium]|nr:multiheme c-type cytochrome [Gammaproteobacteria bacterium]
MLPRNSTNVRQNEYVIWSRMDRHRLAYETLLSDRSREIATNLGLPNAHEADMCLDCHADNVDPSLRGDRFVLADGVGCEACHGGGERYIAAHTADDATHQSNIDAGLYPTDRPEARAKLCLSCHMGTTDKMATHEIMGAGHPRLAFELDTFTILQPAHFRIDEDYVERKWSDSSLVTWQLGQVEAARQSLALIDHAMRATGVFPELGVFDCHACHHPMDEVRWRPQEYVGLPPGSVRLNDAHFVMLMEFARVLAPATGEQLATELEALHGHLGDGNRRDKAIASIRGIVGRLAELDLDVDAHARPLLQAMTSMPGRRPVIDYTVAEQLVMATDMLLGVLDRRKANEQWLETLYDSVRRENAFDPDRFAEVMAGFEA